VAATLTKKQAADAVAVAPDEREIIQANLLDLDGSFGRRLPAGATLTGITKQRWESAARALAALWDLYEAYSAVIDSAAETLARPPGQKGLAEITALLTGRRDTERPVAALLGRCDELRGLFDAYKAKAARLGVTEDPSLAARYDQARELLWTAPCDLTAAADAVNRFQQAALAVGAQRL
jgi:hypothetical protein